MPTNPKETFEPPTADGWFLLQEVNFFCRMQMVKGMGYDGKH